MTSLLLFLSFQVFANEDLRLLEIQALNKAIVEVAAEDLSCEVESDCLKLAYGSRACGGPSGYAVTSKNNVKLETLADDIEEVTRLHKEYNIDNRRVSICSILAVPNIECKASLCSEVETEW